MKSELYSDEEINSIIAKPGEGVEDTQLPLDQSAKADAEKARPPEQSEPDNPTP